MDNKFEAFALWYYDFLKNLDKYTELQRIQTSNRVLLSNDYETREFIKDEWVKKVEELYNGTLNSGSTTFAAGYKFYIVEGDITNNASRYIGAVVPDSSLTSTDRKYCFTDESKYVTFWLSKDNSIVTLTFGERTGTGGIRRVWGIN